jgi:dUTP pyrophosphatase
MSIYSKYILKLFPVSEDARKLYVDYLGGTVKKFPENENAGFDVMLAEDNICSEEKVSFGKLGVKAIMINTFTNQTVHYWLAPRSSIWKNGVTLANSMGVIDRTYRGELMAALMRYQDKDILKGTRVAQILAPDMGHIAEVQLCDLETLDATTRGSGGFGSTGK